MNNTIIECRQKNGQSYNNGDYETKLIKPYKIVEGSSITISNAFIDTQAQTDNKIEIEKDITLELNMFLYDTNWIYDGNMTYDEAGYRDDGADYVVCNSQKFNDPVTNGFTDITSLLFQGNIDDTGIREEWGDTTVQLKYMGISGEAVAYVEVPKNISFRGNGARTLVQNLTITAKLGHYPESTPNAVGGGAFVVNDPSNWDSHKIDYSLYISNSASEEGSVIIQTTQAPPEGEDLEPFIYTKLININEGQYLPEELTEIINNSMGENENINSNFTESGIINTPFLTESNKLIQSTTTYNTVLNSIGLTNGSKEVVLNYSKLQEFSTGQSITLSNIPSFTIGTFNINSLNGVHTLTAFQQTAGNRGGELKFNLGANYTQATTVKTISNHLTKINLINGLTVMEVYIIGDSSLTNGDSIQIIGLEGTKAGINFDTQITGQTFTIKLLNPTKNGFQIDLPATIVGNYTEEFLFSQEVIMTFPAQATKPNIQSINQDLDLRFLCKMNQITEDGTGGYNGLRYKTYTGGNYWIGSNQMDLEFDNNTDLYFWKYVHFPIYMANSSQIIEKINKMAETPTPDKPYYHAGKNGGIVFNSLNAYTRGNENEYYDFWSGKLGFDLNKICVGYTKYQTTLGGRGMRVPIFSNIGNGISTTTARPDIDSLVNKLTGAFVEVPTDFTAVNSTTDLTTEIQASNVTLQTLSLKYSHFLIELQAGYTTDFIGEDTITKNIQGIINRYFSIGQFVSGDSGGIFYTHSGENIYLNSIRVRILDSDKNLAVGLGDDNTIFLSITHPIEQPQQK